MNNRMLIKAEGFTLIEMAIVLVVIGIILGGVLVGGGFLRGRGSTVRSYQKYKTWQQPLVNSKQTITTIPATCREQTPYSPQLLLDAKSLLAQPKLGTESWTMQPKVAARWRNWCLREC